MADYQVIERIIKKHGTLFDTTGIREIKVIETAGLNLVFFFQTGGKNYVLKVMKEGAKEEFSTMLEVRKHIPVPTAFSYGTIDDDEYLLMEKSTGKDAQAFIQAMDKSMRTGFVHDAAVILARLHRSTFNIHKPDKLNSQRLKSVRDVSNKLNEMGINNWGGIQALQAMEPEIGDETCLIHGRYFPSNIMWDKTMISGIVDWSESFWGSPLYDVGMSLFVFNCLGLDALQFLRSYMDEWSKPVKTDLNKTEQTEIPIDLKTALPYFETLAAIEFYIIGIMASKDEKLHDILHSPEYVWTLKIIEAARSVAEKLDA